TLPALMRARPACGHGSRAAPLRYETRFHGPGLLVSRSSRSPAWPPRTNRTLAQAFESSWILAYLIREVEIHDHGNSSVQLIRPVSSAPRAASCLLVPSSRQPGSS